MTQQPNNPTTQQLLLTVTDVAKRLRVDSTTVRRWIAAGVIPAVPLPHLGKRVSYRIHPSIVDAIIAGTLPLTKAEAG